MSARSCWIPLHLFLIFALTAAVSRSDSTMARIPTTPNTQSLSLMKNSKVGPVRLWRTQSSQSFIWHAAVDRTTALASAHESSHIPNTAPLHKALCKDNNYHKSDQLLRVSKNLFSNYTSWLCSGRVTFGLLKAVQNSNKSIDIRDRFLGLGLLRFGQPEGPQFSENNKKTNNAMTTATQQDNTAHCVWSFPITGGLLAVPDAKGDGGKLVLILTKTLQKPDGATGNGGPDDDDDENVQFSLQSKLVDYRSKIVGTAPTNLIRTNFYLGSQSLLHAYVMWRFHHQCCSWNEKQIEQQLPLNRKRVTTTGVKGRVDGNC